MNQLARLSVRFGVIALAFLCSPASPETYFQSGNDIYTKCNIEKENDKYFQASSFCMAYVVGVADSIELNRAFAKKTECVPNGATQGQIKDIVLKYLRDHPEMRNLGASIISTIAITDAFNCK